MARVLGVLVLTGLLAASAGARTTRPQVGDPPSDSRNRCTKPLRHCTDPVVIGVAHHFNGRVEIVAFHSNIGLCINVDRRRSSYEQCGGGIPPRRRSPVAFAGYQWQTGHRSYSGALGWLRPDVASMALSFRRKGEREHARVMVSQVSGDLLSEIREPKPFGFFESTVRGCVPPKHIRLIAYDSAGDVLGRARTRRFPGFSCSFGGGGIDIGPVAAARLASP